MAITGRQQVAPRYPARVAVTQRIQQDGDTWLSDVQAHPPTTPPVGPTVTVEDGQLFLLRPSG